ncbi:TetR family transcriptional regulator [Tamilnaduibacter salinus]|uniref:TetR family transcriptional regulator n=1 Tax=Tamilnaduibacter salinus TaxID=1484056 RepID=A0A2A2I4L0_9GAMM|nr:TetR/AcrR family transcriptional regulator [Tamilnaduibacter salinus]PAV26941.1 TetR family transcriptional regulator [Tamilnaduibacter salinus]PVY70674.1 TetR family transcriptional regulator [Tamilnaduibacter salinus]
MPDHTIQQSLIADQRISDPRSARGRLLTSAARLFREQGYERTTVRDLASDVGIQSGSLFHHFRSKEDILKAVMEETIILNTEIMRAALARAETVRDKLRSLIACELESINGQTGEAMAVLVFEWRSLSDASRAEILKLRDVYEALWMEVLSALEEEGRLKADPFVTRRMLTGALSWTITWYRPGGSMSLEDLTGEIMGMLGL